MPKYEWDESKNKLNRKKHGVWFEEAHHVFDDPGAILFVNQEHSIGEERFISARRATKREIKRYEEGI